MGELAGRAALVTGGARGIGAASAEALARAGAAVLITDLRDEDGEATAAKIIAAGGQARYLRHDVTAEADWTAAVAAARAEFGGLDILVNNAGLFLAKSIADTSLEAFRRIEAVNVEGVFLGMKTAAPAIAERAGQWPGGGAIVNLSSVAGIIGSPFALAYHASKGAVRLMTKAAALEYAALGMKIRVNSVHPGVIETAMGQQVIDEFAAAGIMGGANEIRARLIENHPIGRLGAAGDIAEAVAFLASDRAAFMTGAEMVVDGGLTAR